VWAVPASALFAWLAVLAFIYPPTADESVFAIVAHGMLDGRWPYADLFDHKQPLLYAWYLPYALTGSLEAQRLVGAAALAVSMWPLAALARRVPGVSVPATLWCYAAVLANPFVGSERNAEAFVLAPLLASLATPAPLLAGVLFGAAVTTKAVAIVFLPALLLMHRRRSWPALTGGTLAVPVAAAVTFAPVFGEFWHANFGFNIAYGRAAGEPWWARIAIDPWVLLGALPVWLLVVAGAARMRSGVAWAMAAGGLVAVKAAPFDFAHYYALLAPAAALFAGAAWYWLCRSPWSPARRRTLTAVGAVAAAPGLLLVVAATAHLATQPGPYEDVSAATRAVDGELYVLGDASQVYLEAGTIPELRVFFASPLAMDRSLGERTRSELVACAPDVLVVPKRAALFEVEWAAEVERQYRERRGFREAWMFTSPARPCLEP
jgi:hypothetical protein